MILTPTYHVYDMYKVHQDAMLLDFALICDDYEYDGETLKQVNASVSKDKDGNINMTLCNIDPNKAAKVSCYIGDIAGIKEVCGTVLTSDAMNDHNTFEQPENVKPEAFNGFTVDGGNLTINMPSKSVVLLTIKA